MSVVFQNLVKKTFWEVLMYVKLNVDENEDGKLTANFTIVKVIGHFGKEGLGESIKVKKKTWFEWEWKLRIWRANIYGLKTITINGNR